MGFKTENTRMAPPPLGWPPMAMKVVRAHHNSCRDAKQGRGFADRLTGRRAAAGDVNLCPGAYPDPGPIDFFVYPQSIIVACPSSLPSCGDDNCDGKFDDDGVARCQNKFKSCQCTPTDDTCGDPQSCSANGCNGGWADIEVARCQNAFKSCQCTPTADLCGTPQSCNTGDCNGTMIGSKGTCQSHHAGCACVADAQTPGFCKTLVQCAFCDGIDVGQQFGRCQSDNLKGCTCILSKSLPSSPSPSPSPSPTPTDTTTSGGGGGAGTIPSCQADCLNMLTVKINGLKDIICTNDNDNAWIDHGSSGPAHWWRLSSYENCFLVLATSASSNGLCFDKTAIVEFVKTNSGACTAGDDFFAATVPISVTKFSGQSMMCMTSVDYYQSCGDTTKNGAQEVSP